MNTIFLKKQSHVIIEEKFAAVCEKYNYEKCYASPMVRNEIEKPYFTFSPLLNVLSLFTGEQTDHPSIFMSQICYRTMEKYKVIENPLVTSFQKLLSVFDTNYTSLKKIVDFSKEYFCEGLGLDTSRIYWLISETNEELSKELSFKFQNIMYCTPEHLVCNIPSIEAKCYYAKILYHYNNGLVPIANYVLIDQQKELAKIDSVFFFDRITFILEEKNSIYETYLYKSLVGNLKSYLTSLEDTELYYLSNNLLIIMAMFHSGLIPGSNKAGYVLKKTLREFFSMFILQEKELTLEDVSSLVACAEETLINYDSQFIKTIKHAAIYVFKEYELYKGNITRNANRVKQELSKDNHITEKKFKDLHGTYGVPIQMMYVFCDQLEISYEKDKEAQKYKERNLPYRYRGNNQDFEPKNWLNNSKFRSGNSNRSNGGV